jgi:Putative auto-transporter adhesin, head GIN domain
VRGSFIVGFKYTTLAIMALKSESRSVEGFSEVTLLGHGDLVVHQGSPDGLAIEADESLLQRIESDVRGGRLYLGFRMPWYEWMTWWIGWLFLSHKGLRYNLTATTVEGLFLTGSGSIKAGDLDTGSLEAGITGSGTIQCSGKAGRLEARVTGSGEIDTRGLDTGAASVHISGSGAVMVKARDTLDVRITGSGEVRYIGTPRVSTNISGSGRVQQVSG